MKHLLTTLLLALITMGSMWADTLHDVDSLLSLYAQQKDGQRKATARQLIGLYAKETVFFGTTPTVTDGSTPQDIDLAVWFATERFYTSNAYYKEALAYNAKALPIASTRRDPQGRDIYETLLCDKSYCMFKTSNYTEAIEAGRLAVKMTQQSENWMQLSRAYLYLSLVNHSLRKYDEAKALVVKAIETNERLGLNVQTHNALGIACEIFCSALEVDKAISYGRQAVEAARQIGYQPGVANHLTQLAYAYDRKGDYHLGLQCADSAIAMVECAEPLDRNQLALCLEYKSWNLIDIGRPREAAEALRQAISLEQEVGNTHAVWYDYRTLSEALEPFDPHGSIEALKRYTRMGDSIHSEQLKELMSQANAEFHNDELKGENSLLSEANAQSRKQNRIIFWTALIVVLLLITAIASLLFAFCQKQRTNRAMARLSKTREEFFTNVTHELRTPLTVILGVGNQLRQNPSGDATRIEEWGTTVVRQGEQMLSLVNQMLDISKVKSAIGKPESAIGNLSAYTDMLMEGYQELARQKNIRLVYTTDESPIITSFSANYIQKVLGNLLANAIKFTRSGGKISTSLHQKQGKIVLTVADNGTGIADKDLPHIFEPFYQGHNAKGNGTGIGLALVKQIVENCGGRIQVKSIEGEGTTFKVVLKPLPPTSPKGEGTTGLPSLSYVPLAASVQGPSGRESGEASLLIVEDNADVARLIGEQAGRNYTIHYAANGREGIDKARSLVPDLIITDLMMPGTDGLQLCRAIREDETTSHIPIIIVTAKATEKDRLRGLKAGADAYLCKPFNSEELTLRIEQLLARSLSPRPLPLGPWTLATEGTQEKERESQSSPPLGKATPTHGLSRSLSSEEFVQQLRKAVEEQMLKGKVEVDAIARQLCISVSHLRRKMNSITGMPPKKYIQKMRLEIARDLLDNHPEMTVEEVADQCGFYDHSHFLRYYRELFGTTPRTEVKTHADNS